MRLISALCVLALAAHGKKAGHGEVDIASATASLKMMAKMTAYTTYVVCI